MKINTKQFKAALADVGRVIKGRGAAMGFQCVRLSTTDQDMLRIEASNGDAWITRLIECAGGTERMVVNHSLLSSCVGSISSEMMDVELVSAGRKLSIRDVSESGSPQRTCINTFDVEEFRGDPTLEDGNMAPLAVNPLDLAEGINSVYWAAARDENSVKSQSFLSVLIDLAADRMDCAATTGTYMACFYRPAFCEDRKIMIPASLCPVLVPLMEDAAAEVWVGERMISVTTPTGRASVKLSESPDFDYKRMNALLGGGKMTSIKKDVLRKCCAFARTLNKPEAVPLFNAFRKDGELVIYTRGAHGEHVESVPCEFAQETPIDFATPADQLDMALSRAKDDTVGFHCVSGKAGNATFFQCGDMTLAIAHCNKQERP